MHSRLSALSYYASTFSHHKCSEIRTSSCLRVFPHCCKCIFHLPELPYIDFFLSSFFCSYPSPSPSPPICLERKTDDVKQSKDHPHKMSPSLIPCWLHQEGWRVGSVVRALDWRSKVEGLNPIRGTRKTSSFLSQKGCADSLSLCPTPVCICTHTNDHVRTLKTL